MGWRATKPIRDRVICPTYKVRYPSSQRAQEALDALHERGERRRRFDTPRRVYHCQSCDGWHMTSQPL